MKVAVIPARGGSKRIPRKNIREFHGKPMIAWPIEAAFESKLFDKVLVSTDDHEIASIAEQYRAEVPFIRPKELSDDYSTSVDVLAHATEWLNNNYERLEAVCCIYATAPFITADDIVAGYKALCSGSWHYSFSIARFETSIFRAFTKNNNGGVEMVFPEQYNTRSQDLAESFHDAAQFYWGRPKAWLGHNPIFTKHAIGVQIPGWRAIDIDTMEDLEKAEALASNRGTRPIIT